MTARLSIGLLALALALGPCASARADVLGWLNRRVNGLMNEGTRDGEDAQYDRYLKMLSAPTETGAPASTPAPAQPYEPRITDALREIIPDGGDRESTFFYQNVYLMGVLTAQLGFRTPLRVVGHLGEGIDPGVTLLERIQNDFRKDPSHWTVLRLHQLIERAMAQVQSTHQLMVESRDVLDAVRQQVQRTGELVDRLIAEEGRLQSIPAVLGVSQTTRKGVDNLSAALNTLHSCVTHFRTAFHALKDELKDLEEAAATSSWAPDKQYLAGRKDHIRSLQQQLATAIASMREAGVVVRTDLALIRLNHQGLMQVLTTLSANPLARERRDAGLGFNDDSNADRDRVAGLQFPKINPRLGETVGQLAAIGRDMEARRTRLEEWAKGLRAWRPEPVVVDEVPDWVFTENSLPKREEKWNSYGLLPEREADVDGVIETLSRDLKIGPNPAETAKAKEQSRHLDELLGDSADDPGASPLDRVAAPKAPPPPSKSIEASKETTPAAREYELPGWF